MTMEQHKMADIININGNGGVEDVTPIEESTTRPQAKTQAKTLPATITPAAASPSPINTWLAKIPSWLWPVLGTAAFLGLVYLLHKQYVKSQRRGIAARRRTKSRKPYARAKRAVESLEVDEEE